MSEVEREQMLGSISNENQEMDDFEESLNEKIEIGEELEIRFILSLDSRSFASVLRKFINKNCEVYKLSAGQIEAIRQLCLSPTPNITYPLNERFSLVKEYDVLVTSDAENAPEPYEYHMDEPGVLDTGELYLDFTQGAEDRHIFATSYPLTIRSPRPEDQAIVGGNWCSVRRLFIDWKMPQRLRKVWPVVVDKNGNVIYVPRYRKNYLDAHNSVFKIRF